MTVQLSNDGTGIRVTDASDMTQAQACDLVRDLMQAISDLGGTVVIKTKIPPPTNRQIMAAVERVGKIRQTAMHSVWTDAKVNSEIVMRVLSETSERDVTLEGGS